jgi:uncharacterized membrane protein YeaQ/YmgE (transglycosylase-associated protein family)
MPVFIVAGINIVEIIIFIVIGFLAGWVATRLVEKSNYGFIGNTVIGIIGSIIGGYVSSLLNLQVAGDFGKFILAAIGAVILVILLRFIKR